MSNMNDLKAIARRVMVERGFEPDFSAAALRQLESMRAPAPEAGDDIRDLRSLLWLSIDNDDSRDLDQLSVAEVLPDGATRLMVAIADVDVLVEPATAIDERARHNTVSVYTAAQIFPMLPELLSTYLTSLGNQCERIAVVIEMTVSAAGAIVASDVYRAFVFNHAKLAYKSVSSWLDGLGAPPAAIADLPPLQEQIRIQDVAAQSMRSVRFAHGAMSLETTQSETVFADGALQDLRPAHKTRAGELIEDLMIAANVVTAKFLESKGRPSLRRVLRTPERWYRIVELAVNVGDQLPEAPDAAMLSAFLARRRLADPEKFADLSLSILKMLGSGEYGVDVPGEPVEGHFGLAVSDYTHSTAPNRRFPDLVTQRLLKAALTGRPGPYTVDELLDIAQHCTRQEDEAAKVERQVGKSAAAMLLESRVGEAFDAIVTGASTKGTWVRINSPVAEGRVIDGAHGLDVGDRVRVRLLSADIAKGFIDFAKE